MAKNFKARGFRRVDIQVSVFTAAVAIISCTLISFLYYNVTHYDMIKSLKDRVRSIQTFVVNNLDKNTFLDINTPEDMDTELYRQAHSVFKKAKDLTGVMYLYSGKRGQDGDLIYVVDCIDPDAEDFRSPGDLIESEIVPEMTQALAGREVMPHNIKSTDWGKIFIAYLPVTVDGQVAGVIGVEFEASHQYNTYRLLLLATPFAALVICLLCALVANRLFRRISNPFYKDMFNTDYLTNLKSRNAFEIDLSNINAQKNYEGIGFYVIDLNNLKKVNDTLGHEAGDVYLQAAASSFRSQAGENITVYRTGGDEFVLLSVGDTLPSMERLAKSMAVRFNQNKPRWDIELSFSIGYALYDPSVDQDLFTTRIRADQMMYQKKQEFHARSLP